MSLNKPRLLALSALACLLLSCFEPPVLETLDLRFLRNGAFLVTSTVQITDPGKSENLPLNRRLARVRQELEDGSDPWGRRFAALEPFVERFTWEKQGGQILRGTRAGLADEPAKLRAFFADTSLDVSYQIRDGVAELALVPGPASRATPPQRDEVKRTVESWSLLVANYLKETRDLWTYLDDRPGRARACLGSLLSDLLAEDVRNRLEPLEDAERERVDRLRDLMKSVTDVLAVPEGAAYSPDELSHLAYDPFPARLTVHLPGPPLKAPEGFAVTNGGRDLIAAGPGLWEALRSLEGRWLTPDPMLLYVERGGQGKEDPLDLDAFIAQPRRSEPAPAAKEVQTALEERLRPAALYRVTFAVEPEAELTREEVGWDP